MVNYCVLLFSTVYSWFLCSTPAQHGHWWPSSDRLMLQTLVEIQAAYNINNKRTSSNNNSIHESQLLALSWNMLGTPGRTQNSWISQAPSGTCGWQHHPGVPLCIHDSTSKPPSLSGVKSFGFGGLYGMSLRMSCRHAKIQLRWWIIGCCCWSAPAINNHYITIFNHQSLTIIMINHLLTVIYGNHLWTKPLISFYLTYLTLNYLDHQLATAVSTREPRNQCC